MSNINSEKLPFVSERINTQLEKFLDDFSPDIKKIIRDSLDEIWELIHEVVNLENDLDIDQKQKNKSRNLTVQDYLKTFDNLIKKFEIFCVQFKKLEVKQIISERLNQKIKNQEPITASDCQIMQTYSLSFFIKSKNSDQDRYKAKWQNFMKKILKKEEGINRQDYLFLDQYSIILSIT